MDQRTKVVAYLKEYGTITTKEAYDRLGITQLGARVFELKKLGIPIQKRTVSGVNRDGEPVSFAECFLGGEKN